MYGLIDLRAWPLHVSVYIQSSYSLHDAIVSLEHACPRTFFAVLSSSVLTVLSFLHAHAHAHVHAQILVDGLFDPAHVAALSHHLGIPPSLMFMTCPGPAFPHEVAEFGTRIISL